MDGGVGNELPWASVFDTTANVRALTAIQAEGFRAASKLVDRFILAASDSLNTVGGTVGERSVLSDDQRADLWGATDIEPLVKSWWAMVNQLGRDLAPTRADPRSTAEVPTLEFADASAIGRLDVAASAGGRAIAGIWLSNRSNLDVGDVRLRVSALQSDTGCILSSDGIALAPEVVAMPARSGRGIDLSIEVGEGAAPGLYRGNLLTEGHPELWLPIAVTVEDPAA